MSQTFVRLARLAPPVPTLARPPVRPLALAPVAAVALAALAGAQSLQWTASGNYSSSTFGNPTAIAGDVDGDGIDDVLVGDLNATPVLFHEGQASVLSGADGAVIRLHDGVQALEGVGSSLDGVGDVDGDGRADYVIGAIESAPVVYSGADGSVLHVLSAHGSPWGGAVSAAGDVNADGFPDVLVGAPNHSPGGLSQAGRVYVYSGAFIAQGTPPEILWTFNGIDQSGHMGAAVSAAGDVDGDGFDDLLVGAPDEQGMVGPATYTGAVRIYSGQTGVPFRQHLYFGPFSGFGRAIANVGDLDGDGRPETIVGAPFDDVGATNSGTVWIYDGNSGLVVHELHGNDASDFFGVSVAGVGDVDGDLVPDFLVGANNDEGTGAGGGAAWLFRGATGTLRAIVAETGGAFGTSVAGSVGGADLDGDGYADFLVAAPNTGGGSGTVYAYAGNCVGASVAYCVGAPHSTSATGGSITVGGSSSLGDEDVLLVARSCPPGNNGIFYYGDAQALEPFGDGFRCVTGTTFRLNPPVTIDGLGIATLQLDFTAFPLNGPGMLPPADPRYFQFWFRDPAGPGGTGFNLTDGRCVVFCP